MITLIGSEAAKRTGCLPAWRNGVTKDIDLVGSPSDMASVEAWLLDTNPRLLKRQTGEGRFCFFSFAPGGPMLRIEFNASESASSAMLAAMSDNTEATTLGHPCAVISAATQLAIKEAYEDFDIQREKNDLDIAHWRSMAPPMTDEHADLKAVMTAEFHDLYGNKYLRTPST